MDDTGKSDIPMLSATNCPSEKKKLSLRNRSVTISIPLESNSGQTPLSSKKEPVEVEEITSQNDKNEANNVHLMRSGQFGLCDDPYCTTCPTTFNYKGHLITRVSHGFDHRVRVYGGSKGWVQESLSLIKQFTFGIMNQHAKVVQQWNQFIVISCLIALFIDPLFFFLLSSNKDNRCILIDWPMTKTVATLRSLTDFIYLLHMLVQFRLAFIATESRVAGAGDLVDDPKKVALHYLSGYFFIDLFIVLPLPQIIILLFVPNSIASSGVNYAKSLLRTTVLVQYIPRLFRFLPLLITQSPTNFIYESAATNFLINLVTFVFAGHVVGSCWYLLGLQRVNQCLEDACRNSGIANCNNFLDCGKGIDYNKFIGDSSWKEWKQNVNSTACFSEEGFPYGIYVKAVNLTAEDSMVTRYVYSFFWGFQQISTLAGNQVPSYFVWEVVFTSCITGLGLLLLAVLIGNIQNYLQGLSRRALEMSIRERDVEQWMGRRHLPLDLKIKVGRSERYRWAATQGLNEEMLMENLPEDLRRDVHRHLFKFVKKVPIFALMDEPFLDAIRERLTQQTYIKGGTPLYEGGVVTKMVFIVRGEMESVGEDGYKVPLSKGDACGEELLIWHMEHSSISGDRRNPGGYRLVSKRMVKCLTNVEAFVLRAEDLEEVTTLFSGSLRNQKVQKAIRNESPRFGCNHHPGGMEIIQEQAVKSCDADTSRLSIVKRSH